MVSNSIYYSPQYEEYEFKSKRNWRVDGKYEPFVYIIQEVDTEMMYIGSKTAKNCIESDLGTKYFSSSKSIPWKDAPESFEICRIIPCCSNHDALILESVLIDQNGAIWDSMYYNKHNSGVLFNMSGVTTSIANGTRRGHSEETKLKMSKSKSGNNNPWYGTSGPMGNKSHSEETKLKMSESNRRFFLGVKGEDHPAYGNIHSENDKAKMADIAKNRPHKQCPHCNKSVHPATFNRWHGDKCKIS